MRISTRALIRICLRAATAVALPLAAASAGAAPGAPSAGVEAFVEQPRAFGHVIGDVLTQRVLLRAKGRDVEPVELPGRERIGVWFERRPARVESSPDGRRWLVVDYQLVNAPQALRTVTLPAWTLTGRAGAPALVVGEWPVSVAPLAPREAFAGDGLGQLRPDRPPPAIATEPIRRQIRLWTGAFLVTLAAWLTWWLQRNRRESATQPFARALREMRGKDDEAPEAWQALHRAIDRTAGQVVQTSTLAQLFARAPHLEPLRPRIETFYLQSRERFFGAGAPPDPISVRALCADLRRIEKRQGR